jgi:hypothetical protein
MVKSDFEGVRPMTFKGCRLLETVFAYDDRDYFISQIWSHTSLIDSPPPLVENLTSGG